MMGRERIDEILKLPNCEPVKRNVEPVTVERFIKLSDEIESALSNVAAYNWSPCIDGQFEEIDDFEQIIIEHSPSISLPDVFFNGKSINGSNIHSIAVRFLWECDKATENEDMGQTAETIAALLKRERMLVKSSAESHSDDDTAESRSDDDTSESRSDDDTAESRSDDDTSESRSDDDTAESRSDDDTSESRSDDDTSVEWTDWKTPGEWMKELGETTSNGESIPMPRTTFSNFRMKMQHEKHKANSSYRFNKKELIDQTNQYEPD